MSGCFTCSGRGVAFRSLSAFDRHRTGTFGRGAGRRGGMRRGLRGERELRAAGLVPLMAAPAPAGAAPNAEYRRNYARVGPGGIRETPRPRRRPSWPDTIAVRRDFTNEAHARWLIAIAGAKAL